MYFSQCGRQYVFLTFELNCPLSLAFVVCNTVDHKEKVSLINHIAEKDGFVIAVYKFIKNKNAQS